MGNIADQFLALLVILDLLLGVLPQTHAHLLKIVAQFTDLVVRIHIQREIQIPRLDLLGRLLQLIEGT